MKKIIMSTLIILLIFLGLAWIYSANNKRKNKSAAKSIATQQNLFHPDEVLEISFVFDKNKFQFKRKQRLEFWSKDAFTTQKIHQSLLIMSQLYSQKLDVVIEQQVLRIAFKTDDLTDWIWVSDGVNYRWDAGPHKSKGGALTELQKAFFASRESLFVTQKGVLCQRRPKQFISQGKILKNEKGTWYLLGQIYSNQNQIEKWLGKNCKFKIENLVPIETLSIYESSLVNKMTIKETVPVFRDVKWSDSGYILTEENGRKKLIHNASLVEELNLMKSILDQGGL